MIKFDIITIFPEIFNSYFNESIIKRAQKKKLIKINIHNLRDFTVDKHKTVDDRPYSGGAGMVFKVEPIYKAVKKIKTKSKKQNTKVILFSAKGKKFNQKIAKKFSKFNQIILICGRYEGVDERVVKYIADEEISIGEYVLTGGELPAMVVVDTVSRLIPDVIKPESLKQESFSDFLEYPQYTRPEIFLSKKSVKWRVPKILLSGDHKKIEQWRKKHQKAIAK
ncbi:tRNA (guanosine(37)-N1)-methyltransferase TrmD [Candidatus Parcubacteria bacterium]|nr:tRNA (guanosine(37)-N1)-methyltransferase TrmD [Candidatus Parcubacteria bacterium]